MIVAGELAGCDRDSTYYFLFQVKAEFKSSEQSARSPVWGAITLIEFLGGREQLSLC